jgi:hypothetical protein
MNNKDYIMDIKNRGLRTKKGMVFWVATPSSSKRIRRFGGTYSFQPPSSEPKTNEARN